MEAVESRGGQRHDRGRGREARSRRAGRLRAEGRLDNVPDADALGKIYAAESSDGGETVSESYDTGLDSPAAPCSAARVPATGDVVLVWNNAKPDEPGSGRPRTPLTAAVSRDDGRTWSNFKDIEPDTSRSYMYPVIVFDGDTALVLYSERGQGGGPVSWNNTSLKLARIPYQWFYE